uniref:Uncharacterized protein LOC111127272 n=1 Tax=Crassostrea virginica TaxID=6565 RepID=A0A8B8DJT6_CRAVI|nr:uncharacterized protein LOC111127272 [Crassostrea virginica]
MDPKFKTKGMKTAKLMVLSVLVLLLRGAASQEECDVQRVHDCFVNINLTVLTVNQTAFCNHELQELKMCLQPYDVICQNESLYQLNVQTFEPSTFGCQDIGGVQCDLQAIRRCSSTLDVSYFFTNVTYFCNVELQRSRDCLAVYRSVCSTSSYSDLYDSLQSALQPHNYGCSGTATEQCELLNAIQCVSKFNLDRLEHFRSTGSSMNETALCLHLKSAKSCLTPYERACGSKPSFTRMKSFLENDRCIVPVTTPVSGASSSYVCSSLIVWAVSWVYLFIMT